jgi:hypothetical protein
MSKTVWSGIAIAAAALVLAATAWFDAVVLRDAVRDAQASFDGTGAAALLAVGSILVAASVIVLAALAWRSASRAVGIGYVVVGAFFAALSWVAPVLASGRNGAAPVLPEVIASAVWSLWLNAAGELNAVSTVGAGMLIAGVVVLVRRARPDVPAIGAPGTPAPSTGPSVS